ncbi:AAA domain [Carpediemonas membranifera]|uniref:AAA domain n=1 Tax=Carpediemonas membranifera TaxID=201153 RepID=A0A8J6B4V7_9EUKA|nr:AAA domain [Carpediemonas membranifera]|eukprot:KAG9392927.1 AAA domain [Carpediemonas membranifera]
MSQELSVYDYFDSEPNVGILEGHQSVLILVEKKHPLLKAPKRPKHVVVSDDPTLGIMMRFTGKLIVTTDAFLKVLSPAVMANMQMFEKVKTIVTASSEPVEDDEPETEDDADFFDDKSVSRPCDRVEGTFDELARCAKNIDVIRSRLIALPVSAILEHALQCRMETLPEAPMDKRFKAMQHNSINNVFKGLANSTIGAVGKNVIDNRKFAIKGVQVDRTRMSRERQRREEDISSACIGIVDDHAVNPAVNDGNRDFVSVSTRFTLPKNQLRVSSRHTSFVLVRVDDYNPQTGEATLPKRLRPMWNTKFTRLGYTEKMRQLMDAIAAMERSDPGSVRFGQSVPQDSEDSDEAAIFLNSSSLPINAVDISVHQAIVPAGADLAKFDDHSTHPLKFKEAWMIIPIFMALTDLMEVVRLGKPDIVAPFKADYLGKDRENYPDVKLPPRSIPAEPVDSIKAMFANAFPQPNTEQLLAASRAGMQGISVVSGGAATGKPRAVLSMVSKLLADTKAKQDRVLVLGPNMAAIKELLDELFNAPLRNPQGDVLRVGADYSLSLLGRATAIDTSHAYSCRSSVEYRRLVLSMLQGMNSGRMPRGDSSFILGSPPPLSVFMEANRKEKVDEIISLGRRAALVTDWYPSMPDEVKASHEVQHRVVCVLLDLMKSFWQNADAVIRSIPVSDFTIAHGVWPSSGGIKFATSIANTCHRYADLFGQASYLISDGGKTPLFALSKLAQALAESDAMNMRAWSSRLSPMRIKQVLSDGADLVLSTPSMGLSPQALRAMNVRHVIVLRAELFTETSILTLLDARAHRPKRSERNATPLSSVTLVGDKTMAARNPFIPDILTRAVWADTPVTFLNLQYRMTPMIADLLNSTVYRKTPLHSDLAYTVNNSVREEIAKNMKTNWPQGLGPHTFPGVICLNVPRSEGAEEHVIGKTYCRKAELPPTLDLVKWYFAMSPNNSTVCVWTPHTAQADDIRDAIGSNAEFEAIPDAGNRITVLSGNEIFTRGGVFDFMVMSMVRSNDKLQHDGSMTTPARVSALTSARNGVAFVMDTETFRGDQSGIMQYLKTNGLIFRYKTDLPKDGLPSAKKWMASGAGDLGLFDGDVDEFDLEDNNVGFEDFF